jgi:hypothetical protein
MVGWGQERRYAKLGCRRGRATERAHPEERKRESEMSVKDENDGIEDEASEWRRARLRSREA